MITFFTIVLDGEPFIERHYPVFKTLDIPWRWIVVEGVAANTNCTSWCAKIDPRLSNDGTHEYLESFDGKESRVFRLQSPIWKGGKVQMCNSALECIRETCLLWQVDADEIWTKDAIESVALFFERNQSANEAQFMCRYWVGPDRYVMPEANVYGNHLDYEWYRVWRYTPGMRFKTHEPPMIDGLVRRTIGPTFLPLFDHHAYATRKQMEFRAQYYAGSTNPNAHLWKNAPEAWDRLQKAELPCKLKDFFPWVDDKATVVAA